MARQKSKLVEAVDKLILDTLVEHAYNITRTAAYLNCSVRTVSNHVVKLRKKGIKIPSCERRTKKEQIPYG